MNRAGLDEERAVQIVARGNAVDEEPRLGSGYLAGKGLIVTAAHVVDGADAIIVRRILGRGVAAQTSAHVVWIEPDPGTDIAVLRLAVDPQVATVFPADLPSLRFGRAEGQVECETLGFPLFMYRKNGLILGDAKRLAYRDTHHAIGWTTSLSGRYGGTLEVTVDPPREDPDPKRSPWEGMSGAAVFAGTAMVGVVCEHHRREGANRITARRVEHWHNLAPTALTALRDLLGLPGRDDLVLVRRDADTGWRGGLPRDNSVFTGREREFAALLASIEAGDGGVLAVHAVDGLAGVGKSAFAVHAAHRLADRFPDGQVLIRLHAHTPGRDPVDPRDALAELLLGDGLAPSKLPDELEGRVRRWRERTSGRRMLLVLDDARDAAQVEPLLPEAPGTLVLTTSRRRIDGLSDTVPLDLGVLDPVDAARLVVRTARRPSLDAEDPQVKRLAARCGYLPLALSISAARLAAHPSWSIANIVRQMEAVGGRLEALTGAERSVTAALALSYRDLAGPHRRLLGLLGAHPGTEYEPEAAAVLLDIAPARAHRLLADLEGHRLLDETTPGRYRMHDLVREYAAALAATASGETEAAIDRLLAYYRDTANPPRDAMRAAATRSRDRTLAWLRTERANLLASRQYAVDRRKDVLIIGLSAALEPLLRADGPWIGALAIHTEAVEISQHIGSPSSQASALAHLGVARRLTGNRSGASDALNQAVDIFGQIDDHLGQANALTSLGQVQQLSGRYSEATVSLLRALEIYQHFDDRLGQANALTNLGQVQISNAQYDPAATSLTRALEFYRQFDDHFGQADALSRLGQVHYSNAEYSRAVASHTEALDLCLRIGARLSQANNLLHRGLAHHQIGEYKTAAAGFEQAQELYVQLGDLLGETNSLLGIGRVYLQTGQYGQAIAYLVRTLGRYRQVDDPVGYANSLTYLGRAQQLNGQYGQAEASHAKALVLFRDMSAPGGEVIVLNHYGALRAAIESPAQGRVLHFEALHLARRIHAPQDEADALSGIAATHRTEDNRADAKAFFERALELYERHGCVADATRVRADLADLENTRSQNQ